MRTIDSNLFRPSAVAVCLCLLFQVAEPVEEHVPDFLSKLPPYVEPSDDLYYPYGGSYYGSTTPEPTPKPYIDPTTPSNVTVIKGKTAMLACVVRNLGTAAVSWMRLRDINVMAMNEVTNTKDKRIRAIHVPESDRWALRIQETKLSDDGAYECQVTTENKTVKLVYLRVLDPKTEIAGPSEVFLSKGSTLNLTCVITDGPSSQPFIIWTHNSKMLKYVGTEGGQLNANDPTVVTDNGLRHGGGGGGRVMTRIVVAETDVQHSGTYKCEPGAAPTATVNVHVLDGKLPAAMQTAGVQTQLNFWLSLLLAMHVLYCLVS